MDNEFNKQAFNTQQSISVLVSVLQYEINSIQYDVFFTVYNYL